MSEGAASRLRLQYGRRRNRTAVSFHASIASAKGAVEGLTRSLAAELAPRIRVNAVAPTLTATPLAERLLGNEAKLADVGGDAV